MFETMPTGHTTTVKSGKSAYGQTEREAKTVWVLNPGAEGVPQVVVSLTTYHYGDRKRFSTTLTWGTREPVEPGSAFSVETWSSSHEMIRVSTTPVARYSVKALEAHHAAALTEVEEGWPIARAVFAQAFEESGLGVSS